VVLVIRSGQTTTALVRRTRDLLQSVKANILGIVVNAADLTSPDYYNYYYKSKYQYYSDNKDSRMKVAETRDETDNAGLEDQKEVPN